ncbi:MAG TPA: hypothetical protein VKI65_04125 [Gemmataceae bacterium]|nr:hypothetical protein [Gemmataceae bacterium]
MTRIFTTLAALDALALLLTYASGWISRARDAAQHSNVDPTFQIHFLLALFTAFLTLLVHCLIFTYFLGTGRWVKEVALAYQFPDDPLPKRTRELKRHSFPPALTAMLVTIAAAAAGAAAQRAVWPWWVHFTLATATLLANAWAFPVEYRDLRSNVGVLDEVMREVDRIRARRGLPTNVEALRQETG